MSAFEEPAFPWLDLDSVDAGLYSVAPTHPLVADVWLQALSGGLSPGSQEEAILNGRNCLATLNCEGRFEVTL